MKKYISIIILVLIVVVGFFLVQGSPIADDRPVVAVTIPPLYDVAEDLFGTQVRIVQLLPAGASPHTYSLKPKQAQLVSQAEIVFAVGYGIDDWVTQVATEEQLQLVSEGIDLRTVSHSHADDEEDGHEEDEEVTIDPHYWLSYINAQNIINTIALRTLAELELENEEEIEVKAKLMRDTFAKAKLDADVLLNEKEEDLRIVTFHDGWRYFTDELGIEVVDVFEDFPGKEATAADIAKLQQTVQEYGISVIFSEPQLASDNVESLLQDAGLELRILDPLGGVEGRDSYLELLQYNLREIIR